MDVIQLNALKPETVNSINKTGGQNGQIVKQANYKRSK